MSHDLKFEHQSSLRFSLPLMLCIMGALFVVGLLGLQVGCSSEPLLPPSPGWVSQPTRTVDNGYIVYVGESEASTQSRAQLQAEGVALEDLANECSMVPKGTRVEDRYHVRGKTGSHVFVKIAVEFQECNEASKSVDPLLIRQIANIQFTEQLKKYQDLEETGDMPDSAAVASITTPSDVPAAPSQGGMSASIHYYAVRQYVAYQKEVVILSPPTAYQPASVESAHFVTQVQPAVTQVASYQTQDPALKSNPQAWSKLPDRPHMERPAALAPRNARRGTALRISNPPDARNSLHVQDKNAGRSRPQKRRRRARD